jgi:F0F1-type ATP synthase gamma subunit
MNDDLKDNIFTMIFVLFYNIESGNYFIMQPGMKKSNYLTKDQRTVIEQYKKMAIYCKNLAEVGKISKQYAELFKDQYPEFYI